MFADFEHFMQNLHMFSKKEEVKSIGNPAGIGKGTGFGLRERDRDGTHIISGDFISIKVWAYTTASSSAQKFRVHLMPVD